MDDEMLTWLERVHRGVEVTARASAEGHPGVWKIDPDEQTIMPNGTWVVDGADMGVAATNGDTPANILVFNQPSALLERVLSERKIIAMYQRAEQERTDNWLTAGRAADEARVLSLAVQRLAEAWRHMPGWDARWVQTITCPFCGWSSPSQHDIDQRYCGHCHAFHDLAALQAEHMRP